MPATLKKGSLVELTIEKLALGGRGLARLEDFVIFVAGALPSQRVRAALTRKKSQWAEARCLEVLAQPGHYLQPFCPHFGPCGGCVWQELPYAEQLYWKRLHIQEALQHLAGLEDVEVAPLLPAPHTTYYRNKMEFTFAERPWLPPAEFDAEVPPEPQLTLGLHVRGHFDRVLDITACQLQSPESMALVNAVRSFARNSGLSAYSQRTHQGFWRFLAVREGKRTAQTLVHIVTAPHPQQKPVIAALASKLRTAFPHLTTLVHSISASKAQVALGESSQVIFGPGVIEEDFCGARFQISASSFFQTNTECAENIVATIAAMANFSGSEKVWDLYCGTGSIAIAIAPKVQSVLGCEISAAAVSDAQKNAARNGISNCAFVAGDIKELVTDPSWVASHGTPDLVIVDPPRAGMHPQVCSTLLKLAPPLIIMVSCNPATMARDLEVLSASYALVQVQPLDLFPHTAHSECVAKLVRRS